MKLKIIGLMLLLAQMALADGKEIKVGVNGMVCSFCAQGITKKFRAEAAIESVDVKLGERLVALRTKDHQDITDARIKELLMDSGYNVEKIERN